MQRRRHHPRIQWTCSPKEWAASRWTRQLCPPSFSCILSFRVVTTPDTTKGKSADIVDFGIPVISDDDKLKLFLSAVGRRAQPQPLQPVPCLFPPPRRPYPKRVHHSRQQGLHCLYLWVVGEWYRYCSQWAFLWIPWPTGCQVTVPMTAKLCAP